MVGAGEREVCMAGMSDDGMVEIEKPVNAYDVEQELAMTHAKSCAPDTCIAVMSNGGMMEMEKPVNVDDSKCDDGTENVELCAEKEKVEQELAITHAKSCAPDTCIAVMSNDGMMEIEKPGNIDDLNCDATEQEELCVEKEKFSTLDGAELDRNCAPDTCVAKMSDEMMEIQKPINVDDSKCDDGNEQELCVEKEKFRILDGAELDSCAQNCAPDTCMAVMSEGMMEIDKPENVDDSKCDRQRAVDAATEQEGVCVEKQKIETFDKVELDCCVTNQVKNCAPDTVDAVEVEHCATNREPDTADGVEVEGCATNPKPETVESEGCATNREPETVELEGCDTNREPETVELEGCATNREPETVELEGCATNDAPETLNTEEMECDEKELKKVDNCDNQPDVRIDVKEDDMLSEVSNPNLSPRENTSSFQTASSQGVDLLSNNQGGSGEITSSLSGNSNAEESVSEEEHNQIDASKAVSKSSVVLEIPEEFSTTGVRKITFKFSKRKEDYGNASAASALPVTAGVDYGFSEAQTWNPLESDDMSLHGISSTNEAVYQHRDPFLCPQNMELKMSKKVTSNAFPTNVKKLLSTGILEGARVKYISTSGKKELLGIIKDYGYLCGCSLCNFSKILSAYEFEMHAGGKTRHPNNHIYLENGKPIYRIIQELKTTPLSQLEEVVKDVAGSSINEQYLEAWKAKLLQSNEVASAYQYSHGRASGMYQYKPSDCSSVMEDGLYPASYSYIDNFPPNPYSSMETAESWKHVVKKPRCNFSSSIIEPKKSAEGGTKKRDNDLHRSLFMPNGLPDGTDLAYYSKGKKVLGGYKQGNGIVCSCCDTEISPSQFEAHAGCAAKRQPYRHIYTSNGLTLHDIALMLANGQSIATNNSDDMCTICGDAGELICCEGCPRAFHAACLGLQCTPTSGWLCSYCRDRFIPGRKNAGDAGPIMIRLTRVVKAPESEGGGCVVCRTPDFSVAKFDDRTVMLCDQCEKEYHVGCLRESGLCDLKELPKDKWFCCNDCNKVYVVLQNCVLKGAEVIPAPAAAAVTKKQVQNCLMDTTTNDIQWRILSGKSRFAEHLPLLSSAAVIFRECFDPIVAKSGRDLIPVMVYGRNISGQEFGGMYCIVLIVKSVVVSAGLLRIFGQEVAELPLVATSRENQGKGYFQALFGCIEILLSSMHVKNLVLPAAEEAESIWTNKLGFRKMTDERYLKYSRDYQLTIFKGTSMLEKEVQQTAYES